MQNEFELIVRALVIHDKKILVCQTKGRSYYFLPGGHVEYGENMQTALKRELHEELGVGVTASKFIGGIENIFQQDEALRHEVSFVFWTEIDTYDVHSKEDHVDFFWFTMDEFIDKNIVPSALKDAILKWTADKEIFFVEERGSV